MIRITFDDQVSSYIDMEWRKVFVAAGTAACATAVIWYLRKARAQCWKAGHSFKR